MSRPFLHALVLVSSFLACTTAVFLSYFLSRRLAGRSLRIGRIGLRLRPLSLHIHDFRYTHTVPKLGSNVQLPDFPFSLTSSHVHLTLHIPRPSHPRWATLVAEDNFHTSPECSASISTATIVLWLFPYAFRFTAGPCTNVQLDDFRVRVFTSKSTPKWVERLRRNLVMTVLQGEILRCDDFKTSVRFGVPDLPGATNKPGEKAEEEMMVTTMARGYHVMNWQGRIYTFGGIDAQLRKSLESGKGRFVMIVEEGRWTKVHEPFQREAAAMSPWLQIPSSIFQLPMELYHLYLNPTSGANIYVTRTDVTFDEFRIKDAEITRQAGLRLQEHLFFMGGVAEDIAWHLLSGVISPSAQVWAGDKDTMEGVCDDEIRYADDACDEKNGHTNDTLAQD